MELPLQSIAPATEALLQQLNGPLTVSGTRGEYVVMRAEIYSAMLGISDDSEAETIASVRRGIADFAAGRTQDLDEAFNELDARDAM
jgi:PHD/YefM family antitoxin component YafN of YafNO toxin-antitoxin module